MIKNFKFRISNSGARRKLYLIVSRWFQFLFHSPSGVLFTFPSRYLFTIGHQRYLALGCGHPGFPQGSSCLAVLKKSSDETNPFCVRDCHPLWSAFPGRSIRDVGFLKLIFGLNLRTLLQPLAPCGAKFKLLPFRSPLLREYSCPKTGLFSFPLVNKMFQFTRYPLRQKRSTHIFICVDFSIRKPPVNNVCARLTEAYRSVPRPSSAVSAKASTICR